MGHVGAKGLGGGWACQAHSWGAAADPPAPRLHAHVTLNRAALHFCQCTRDTSAKKQTEKPCPAKQRSIKLFVVLF